MKRIGIVAGEASGDLLAADLMKALKKIYPNLEFVGIAGPEMIKQGCQALVPAERLSLIGLIEIIAHLADAFKIRKTLLDYYQKNPIDCFIGVDLPEFNLSIEGKLKKRNIPIIHYVSPTVWAWRASRIKKIVRRIDLMLTLFPFEASYYRQQQILVKFVGHPLADIIDLHPQQEKARIALNIDLNSKVIALLPGSRGSEIKNLTPPFLAMANFCQAQDRELKFIVPFVSEALKKQFENYQGDYPHLNIIKVLGQSRQVMQASNVIVLASGTATLEALLLKKPMIVAYKISEISYQLAKRIIHLKNFSLPNLLSGKTLVEEFIQHKIHPEAMAKSVMTLLHDKQNKELLDIYMGIHQQLRKNSSQQAALAISALMSKC